jgi:hypothetical protein
MQKKIKHIHAKRNEWVQVHRDRHHSNGAASGGDPFLKIGLWVGGILGGLWIIQKLLPILMIGFIGWIALHFSSRR